MRKLVLLAFALSCFFTVHSQGIKKEITLEDIWQNYSFYARPPEEVTPMKDGEHYCMLENEIMINEYEYKSAENVKTIVRTSQLIPEGSKEGISIDKFEFSNDETKILIATNTEQIYRHSSISDYYVWDIKTSKLTKLSNGGKERLASFSPSGTKVAFVRENNLFIKDLVSGKENKITSDGLINNIIYGTTDWVYEEEFSFTNAYFWSPKGDKLAFYRFDESKVKEYDMVMYDSLYPTLYKYKYPKAGENNSVVGIYVYDLNSGKTASMDIGKETDIYIPRIKWTKDDNVLSIQRMNRLQNKLEIMLANATAGTTKVIYKKKINTTLKLPTTLISLMTVNNLLLPAIKTDTIIFIYITLMVHL